MKTGKSLEPDGFTATYYEMFLDDLVSPFLQAFNSISATTSMHDLYRDDTGLLLSYTKSTQTFQNIAGGATKIMAC